MFDEGAAAPAVPQAVDAAAMTTATAGRGNCGRVTKALLGGAAPPPRGGTGQNQLGPKVRRRSSQATLRVSSTASTAITTIAAMALSISTLEVSVCTT